MVDSGKPWVRRKILGLLGLITSTILFFNSQTLINFGILTVYGTIVVIGLGEFFYTAWNKLNIRNKYLRFLSVFLLSFMLAAIISLPSFMVWTIFNGFTCAMAGETPAENQFTGQCKLVRVCGQTPWYYKNGCTQGKTEPSKACINALETYCAPNIEEYERPELCKDYMKLPEKYSTSNNTVKCP